MTEVIPTEDRTAIITELTGEGPIFRDDRFAARLSVAANAYLDDYVYSPEEFVAGLLARLLLRAF